MPERLSAAQATIDQTTDQTKQDADSEPETELEKKSLLDLSLAQVLGGALAAMTAAALGSRLSLVGTVVGAALASVIAAVSGALYTASLRRTRQTVRAVIGGRPTVEAAIRSRAGLARPSSGVSAVADRGLPSPAGIQHRSAKASRVRAIVVTSLVGAMATFALAAGALTMYEALSGHALSGGGGTTLSQVQRSGRDHRPTDKHTTPAGSKSADPSQSTEPSTDPSATPSTEPRATEEPSAEPSLTPAAEPSATAVPSAPASGQTPPPGR